MFPHNKFLTTGVMSQLLALTILTMSVCLSPWTLSQPVLNFVVPGGSCRFLCASWDVSESSLLLVVCVLFVAGVILVYSELYMDNDPHGNRFLLFMGLFIASMLLLVTSNSMPLLFVGWDGLGLSSYYLVAHYMTYSALGASAITFLTNRLGDGFLLLAVGSVILSGDTMMPDEGSTLGAAWLFALAAMTKSAQLPFSMWLPAAMAAPTPVSALVHSSTLVTAGVILLMRVSFKGMEQVLWFFSVIGIMTTLMAGIGAVLEKDAKKVVAFSTLSQIGLMVFMLSSWQEGVVCLHLIVHAFLKALLFLAVGMSIYYSGHSQIFWMWGGLGPSATLFVLPAFVAPSLSLMGLWFVGSFESKELSHDTILQSGGMSSVWAEIIFWSSLCLTVLYTSRLLSFLTSHTEKEGEEALNIFSVSFIKWTFFLLLLSFSSWKAVSSVLMTPTVSGALGLKTALLLSTVFLLLCVSSWALMVVKSSAKSYGSPLLQSFFLYPLTHHLLPSALKNSSESEIGLGEGWGEVLGGQGVAAAMWAASWGDLTKLLTISGGVLLLVWGL